MRPWLRRSAIGLVLTLSSAGCAGGVAIQGVDELKGEWKGRRFGPVGNAPASMIVGEGGAYKGVTFLDGGDRAFHGALVVVRPGQIRYQGSDGMGTVRISEDGGRRMLKFLRDEGGVDAVFRE